MGTGDNLARPNDSQQMTQEWECLAYRLKRLRKQGVAIACAFGNEQWPTVDTS
jgi:hypothetical protein